MPNLIHVERPVWEETGDPALPYRVQTSQYTCLFAGWLDAGAGDGLLWCVQLQGHNLCYAPEFVGYVDHLNHVDILTALPHVPAQVDGDTIIFDAGQFSATFTARVDRVKLSITIREPFRAPDSDLVNQATALMTLSGGIVIPPELEVRDSTGAAREGDWATAGDICLYDPDSTQVIQYLERISAEDADGRHGHGELRVIADVDGAKRLYEGVPWAWLQVAEHPVDIDPTVVTTSFSQPTAFESERLVDRFSNDGLLVAFLDGTNLNVRYSQDLFQNVQTPATGSTVACTGTTATLRIDDGNNIHIAYRDGATVYYRRGTPTFDASKNLTGITWTAAQSLGAGTLPAMHVHKQGTGWRVHVVYADSGTTSIKYRGVNVSSTGTLTLDAAAATVGAYSSTGYPSIESYDNATFGVAWTKGTTGAGNGVRFRPGTWSGTAMTFGTEEAVLESIPGAGLSSLVIDSLGRFTIVIDGTDLTVYRRGASGGWTDISPSPAQAGDDASLVCAANDDVYMWFSGVGGINYRRYTGAWGATVNVGSGSTPSTRRDTTGNGVDLLYKNGTAVNFYRLALNQPPAIPTNLTRAAFDATGSALFSWQHNDPDGDAQGSRQVQIKRVDTGVTVFDSGKVAASAQSFTLPANTLTNGVQHQWRVMTWDTQDTASPWSDWATFTTNAAPTAAVTSSTGTISADSYTLTWSYSAPSNRPMGQYRVKRYDPTLAVVQADSGIKQGAGSAYTFTGLANGASYRFGVQVADADGIWGAEVITPAISVSFTPPVAGPFTVQPQADVGCNLVQFSGQGGDVDYNIVYRRPQGGAWQTLADDVPRNGQYPDYTAASGVLYEYQGDAVGTNGVATATAVVTATLNLARVWVHDVTDPPGTILQVRQVGDISPTWTPEVVPVAYAGRDLPVVEIGESADAAYGTELFFADVGSYRVFEALAKSGATLCVRDSIGNKKFGVIRSLGPTCPPAGHVRLPLDLMETDYSEEV